MTPLAAWSDFPDALRALLDHGPDPMMVKDLEGRFLFMNPAGFAFFGTQDVIGKTIGDLLGSEWGKKSRESDFRLITRGESLSDEVAYPDHSGKLRTFTLIKHLYRGPAGDLRGIFSIMREITPDKEAESKLQKSESRFFNLLEATFEGIAIHENGIILEANEGLARIFALPLDEVIGMNAVDMAIPQDRERIIQHMRSGYDKVYEVEGVRGDGRRLHVELLGQPCLYRGRMARLVAFRDTTDRHRLEAALREQNEKLTELDRLKNGFISSVSHELRTPLASIMGYAEFLEDEVAGSLNPDQQAFVHQIVEGGRRLQLLVNDLLDFARFDSGTFRIHPREADLAETLREIAESLQPQAHEAQLMLEAVIPVESLPYAFDPERIEQVLLNLLGNAIKFTPTGGTIRLRLLPGTEEVRVEVEDSGLGIAEVNLPKLFQKFFQIDARTTREKGGAGLGLSISKALVESHGGQIGVVSVLGRGSTFWFTLPKAKQGAASARPSGPRGESAER